MQSDCGRGCDLDDPRFEFQECLCVPHNLPVSTYWPSCIGIKRPDSESNNAPVSSAQVVTHNTKFHRCYVWIYTYKQQKLKAVRGSRTEMYVKEWAVCSGDWYSAVREVLSLFAVNILQHKVFDCLNCECGGNKLHRKLIIL